MQKILDVKSIDRIRKYNDPQHEPGKKSKLDTNKLRRVWLCLPQTSKANLLEDLTKGIVASKIILLIYVLPLNSDI